MCNTNGRISADRWLTSSSPISNLVLSSVTSRQFGWIVECCTHRIPYSRARCRSLYSSGRIERVGSLNLNAGADCRVGAVPCECLSENDGCGHNREQKAFAYDDSNPAAYPALTRPGMRKN